MASKVFTILADFQFETAAAIAGSDLLAKAVGGISDASQGALDTMANLGRMATSYLGLGGGVLGLLGSAVKASENFTKNSLAFSNIISANLDTMVGDVDSFNDRLSVSGKILREIAADANKFSLDEGSLIEQVKMLGAMLAPKGAAGENFSVARDLGRNFLKSAPTLGVNPWDAQGQMVRMMEGAASMGDTLFRRLVMETEAFSGLKKQGGTASKTFNNMAFDRRLELMQKAMEQFANDADVLAGNAGLLANQITRIKDLFLGVNSVLKPLGDVLVPKLKEGLKGIGDYINVHGRRMAEEFAKFLAPIIENPEQLYYTLQQLADLRKNLELTSKAATGIAIGQSASWLFKMITGMSLLSTVMKGLAATALVTSITGLVSGIAATGLAIKHFIPILKTMGHIFLLLGKATGIVTVFMVLFQTISRAMAIANTNDIKYAATHMANWGAMINTLTRLLSRIISPFMMLIDNMAQAIAPIFEVATRVKILHNVLGPLGAFLRVVGDLVHSWYRGMVMLTYGFTQLFSSLSEQFSRFSDLVVVVIKDMFERVKTLNFTGPSQYTNQIEGMVGGLNQGMFANIGAAMREGAEMANNQLWRSQLSLLTEDKNVSQQTTNIGTINIRQDFKENMEPDRIATSFTSVLKKLAMNPTQAAGSSIQNGYVVGVGN